MKMSLALYEPCKSVLLHITEQSLLRRLRLKESNGCIFFFIIIIFKPEKERKGESHAAVSVVSLLSLHWERLKTARLQNR